MIKHILYIRYEFIHICTGECCVYITIRMDILLYCSIPFVGQILLCPYVQPLELENKMALFYLSDVCCREVWGRMAKFLHNQIPFYNLLFCPPLSTAEPHSIPSFNPSHMSSIGFKFLINKRCQTEMNSQLKYGTIYSAEIREMPDILKLCSI